MQRNDHLSTEEKNSTRTFIKTNDLKTRLKVVGSRSWTLQERTNMSSAYLTMINAIILLLKRVTTNVNLI